MSGNSKIEWTEKTWNPVTGCDQISPGCKHCYAKREWVRLSANPKTVYFGRAFTDVECHEGRLEDPLHWRKPAMIFVNSMSDLFHEDVPDAFLCAVFKVMCEAKQHNFQVLTKRPERMREFLSRWNSMTRDFGPLWPHVWPQHHVWLGVSVESPKYLTRLDVLREVPAAMRMVSFEPLLADLGEVNLDGIGWAIVGGESGPNARPMHPDWARSIRDQCQASRVPFFFKQWGEWVSPASGSLSHAVNVALIPERKFVTIGTSEKREIFARIGKHAAGRKLDGVEWSEYPERVA